MPEDESVLLRILIITATDGLHLEAETLVEAPAGLVRLPHLQRSAASAGRGRIPQDSVQQPPGYPLPPLSLVDSDTVDVQLVEDHPARAISDDGAVLTPGGVHPGH